MENKKAEIKKHVTRLSESELKKLAMDFVDGKVFGTWCNGGDISFGFLQMCYFGAPIEGLTEEETETFRSEIGHIYEYLDKAGERSVNGLPMFMSGNILHKEDCTQMGEFAKAYIKVKQEFEKNGR